MSRANLGALLALSCVLGGCVNEDITLYEVELSGLVEVEPNMPTTGNVHLEFLVAEVAGEGALQYPLYPFASRTLPSLGDVQETVLYPKEKGKGLLVYGWADSDGDGLFCGAGQPRVEPSGAVLVEGFPAHALSFRLSLGTPCAGPEVLYP